MDTATLTTTLWTPLGYLPLAAGSETLVHDLQLSQEQSFVASNSSKAEVQSQPEWNHIICKSKTTQIRLTLILLTWRIWWAPNNASRWQMEFNSACKGVNLQITMPTTHKSSKAVPLQAWSGPEDSRKIRFPDYMTTAQDGGKVVSLTHRPPLPPGNTPGTHFC
jgi:hypothetical protein